MSEYDAYDLSVLLGKHYPTPGPVADKELVCQCGFRETRSLHQRYGSDGLDVHRVEVAVAANSILTPKEKILFVEDEDELEFVEGAS